jgi:hypothetical protein
MWDAINAEDHQLAIALSPESDGNLSVHRLSLETGYPDGDLQDSVICIVLNIA